MVVVQMFTKHVTLQKHTTRLKTALTQQTATSVPVTMADVSKCVLTMSVPLPALVTLATPSKLI